MDEFIVELAELAKTPRPRSVIGGKAHQLALLMADGLPVPWGLVVTAEVVHLEPARQDAVFAHLQRRLREQTGTFAVRSSASLEDDTAGAAPGIFCSLLHVSPADLEAAIRQVWASATTELVTAYARARGVEHLSIATIVQLQVPERISSSCRAGTLYTRMPGRPDSARMQLEVRFRGDQPLGQRRLSLQLPRASNDSGGDSGGESDAHETQATSVATAGLQPSGWQRLRDLALRAERAIGADRGADVEWVGDGERWWLVQARPVVHPPPRDTTRFPAMFLQFSRARPELQWRWDVTHNPDPLSPAQTGLVQFIDDAGVAPYLMRVVGGYLYTASEQRSAVATVTTADELRARIDHELKPAMDDALAPMEHAGEPAPLPDVLDSYRQFYRIYASQLTPLLGASRRTLTNLLTGMVGDQAVSLAGRLTLTELPAPLHQQIADVARGRLTRTELLARVGHLAPAWDVACPTFGETPEVVERAVTAAGAALTSARRSRSSTDQSAALPDSLLERISPTEVEDLGRHLALARTARAYAEADDRWFARAQAGVRRALLALARRWRFSAPDDIFYVPLEAVRGWHAHGHPPPPTRVQRMAHAGRAAIARQRRWHPPLSFADGQILTERPSGGGADSWHGQGMGARVSGPAVTVHALDELPAIAAGSVVVTATVTPAMALWGRGAAAIVAQHGGLLDHGPALARELGIPCVVDCASAWRDIRSGDQLWVDGDAGLVVRTKHV